MSKRSRKWPDTLNACSEEGRFGETEGLLTRIGLGEYLAQVFGGIPMSQGEIVRLADFGLAPERHRAVS